MKLTLKIVFLSAMMAMLSACSTPESRINQNPTLFATFPPDAQAKIRKGQIDIGYTRDMVQMALDKPSRTYTRLTDSGMTEVWAYTETYTTTSRQLISGTFRVRDRQGFYRDVEDQVWADVPQEHEVEKLRVEFVNGVVKAIETVNHAP